MWVIKPKKSVGPLSIGDKIRDAKEKLGNEYGTFKRVPDAEDTVFAFDPCGVHFIMTQIEFARFLISKSRLRSP